MKLFRQSRCNRNSVSQLIIHSLRRLAAACLTGFALASPNAYSQKLDFVETPLPFPTPKANVPAALPGVVLSGSTAESVKLRQAFFAGNFALVESALERHHTDLLSRSVTRGSPLIEDLLEETHLAGIDRCREWTASKPRSYSAHWICGAMWHDGAWQARSSKYSKDVTPAQFALMRERLYRAKGLLETAAGLTEQPVEAYTLLAVVHTLLDEHKLADHFYAKAEKAAAWYKPLHDARANFAQPLWGGSRKAVSKAIAHAEKSGLDADAIANMRDAYEARPWDTPTPGAEKDYWERALAKHPTWARAHGLAQYHWRLERWREMLAATERMLAINPNRAEGYRLRALAHEHLGNQAASVADLYQAAALGNNFATDSLIRVHIQGNLGQPAQNWSALDVVCRYGAALGVPAAANCLGGAYMEATADTTPFRKDIQQGYAWHLLAARGGYPNSQHDLGWMLFTGRAPGVKPAEGKPIGLFWLRRAVEQDHAYAIRKLEAARLPLSEPVKEPLPLPAWTKLLPEIRL